MICSTYPIVAIATSISCLKFLSSFETVALSLNQFLRPARLASLVLERALVAFFIFPNLQKRKSSIHIKASLKIFVWRWIARIFHRGCWKKTSPALIRPVI